jgi:SAM-dependent methyltransferase
MTAMKSDAIIAWPLRVRTPEGLEMKVPLWALSAAPTLRIEGDTLRFDVPEGQHVYLSSSKDARFAVPPVQTALQLRPDSPYRLRGTFAVEGGPAALWLIEYSASARLIHWARPLRDGELDVSWSTDSRYVSCCVALRLSGGGRLRCASLELTRPAEDRGPKTGPRGGFRARSIFFDPCGYKPYIEKHHRFYDQRRPDWYQRVVGPFAECSAVLEIGSGPGLLLEALREAGVAHAFGLERDPVYLEASRERGVAAIQHDLNEPFPFVESASVDGVVSHSSFDYLAPIAARMTLRECLRVLKPGGLLRIVARIDGQASGDEARCSVPLTPELLRRLLREAGFDQIEVSVRERAVEAAARRPGHRCMWNTRSVVLNGGYKIHPWGGRRDVLAAAPDAWDNVSTRDFTILTDARKDEYRVAGCLIGYYTGYRQDDQQVYRAICRGISDDGITWRRGPAGPVLEAGKPGAWDAGGVAAGSVIACQPAGRTRYVMYFSGRAPDGRWPGVGIAYSEDGINWEKQPGRVLAVEEYPQLKHLALADVIQTLSGRWLMHCEGWIEGQGWAIFQAASGDGIKWRPTQTGPVLHARDVPWGGQHAANPKCVEVDEGHYVLGFNVADPSGAFQLALAESADGRRWRPIDANPVICTVRDDFRVESMFMTRDAWHREDRRVYFFSAASRDTHLSSRVVSVEADTASEWVATPWGTQRCGLYRVRADRLIAEPGAVDEPHALSRTVPLDKETQCTLRLAPESAGRGVVLLSLAGQGRHHEIHIYGDGHCTSGGKSLTSRGPSSGATAVCLRIVLPPDARPETVLTVWHGEQRDTELQEILDFTPETLHIRIKVPPGEPSLIVDHVDVWQPVPVQMEAFGDAHMYMGVCRSGDDLLPDIDREAFRTALRKHEIGRAIVTTYGSTRQLDSFDQISPLTREQRGCIYPLIRVRSHENPTDDDKQFQVNQLEVLWQKGLLAGLKVKLNASEVPGPEVLQWAERRQVLTMWHVGSTADLEWLQAHVLRRYSFPVLLSHFGGYPLDRHRYQACIALLDRCPQLYLITSTVFFTNYLEEAIRRHPHRVLLGSDFPGIDPGVSRAAILALEVPETSKALVVSENLRFLTERVAWHRWNALRDRRDLLFPALPETPEATVAQGFKIIPPNEMPPDEPREAHGFWSSSRVSSFYLEHKPWATLVAQLARDLGVRSVLEFGCHVGRNLVALREALPDVHLIGLDINEQAVRAGRERSGLDLRVGDQSALSTFQDGEFDLVFTVSVLDHIPAIAEVCRELIRVAARNAFFLEVTLPLEGKVVQHFDHRRGSACPSTGASYSWFVDRYVADHPRVWRLDRRPCYLHSSSLGPYYWSYLAFLEEP